VLAMVQIFEFPLS